MRKLSKKNPSLSSPLGRFFSSFSGRKSDRSLAKAPRRRDIEQLEERQMLTVNFADNPLFEDQWHLLATGQLVEQPTSSSYTQSQASQDINVLGAWDLGYTGSGVQVAIYDSGFDLDHPDLNFALISEDGSFLDVISLDQDPNYIDTTDFSGTSVAGVVSALDNTIGGVGVAPGADLIPVRFVLGDNDVAEVVLDDQTEARYEFLQFAGVPLPGDDNFNSTDTVDVYLRGYTLTDNTNATRDAVALNTEQLNALEQAATLGRGTWLDLDGDGIFEAEEIQALGAINVVPSGTESNVAHIDAFGINGIIASSQYDGLANSRFTIAVGVTDYDGDYTNVATGGRGSWGETGANVLIVAPSQTIGINVDIDVSNGDDFIGGLTTTDNQGDDGSNSAPIFGQELDGDFQPDTDYSSAEGGGAEAAAQVAGVVALMLEANPNLSYRDVQQILLMSAEQIDIFDETWIVNSYTYFEDVYTPIFYNYVDFDGDPSEEGPSIEDGAIPDFWGGEALLTLDKFGNLVEKTTTSGVLPTTFFQNDFVVQLEEPDELNPDGVLVDVNLESSVTLNGQNITDPLYLYPVDHSTGEFTAQGFFGLLTPIAGADNYEQNLTTSLSGSNFVNGELEFTNGAGFTISWGYGDYLEEYGFAHGALDAELAVELAEQWEIYDLYLEEELVITTSIQGGNGADIGIQASAEIPFPETNGVMEIPGGLNEVPINTAYFTEFYKGYEYTNLEVLTPDGVKNVEETDEDGNTTIVEEVVEGEAVELGSVITAGPWFYPDGGAPTNTWVGNSLAFPIDTAVSTDFMSVEWIEFTAELTSGDIDDLRISLVSPDGTQSELNPFRHEDDFDLETYQHPQLQQGALYPGFEILDDTILGSGAIVNDDGTTAFIDGQEDYQVIGLVSGTEASLTAGESWTWTTNRHWGELFSTEAQNTDVPGGTVDGQWYILVENWGDTSASFSSQYQIDVYGVEATGNRIQGKIGVDDNAQGREDQDNDQLFNFNRNMLFGQATLETAAFSGTVQLVLDDPHDSVHYANNYYETVDDSTGEVFRYAVVDDFEYTALAELNKGAVDFDMFDALGGISPYSSLEVEEWYAVYGSVLGFEADPDFDGFSTESDIEIWRAELTSMIMEDIQAAETFEPQLNYSTSIDSTLNFLTPATDTAGNVFTYQNFDFNQETFASNVIVQATQYVVNYDAAGNALPRVATGVLDYFVTGADGNYWFDVEATPEPPQPSDFATTEAYQATYDQWLSDYGQVFEYEISLVGDADFQDRIIDKDYSEEVDFIKDASSFSASLVEYGAGSIDYQSTQLLYNVPIWASPDINNGQMTVIDNVNFLLEVDPAETAVDIAGSVYRDQDGDSVFDISEVGIEGAVIYYDADNSGTRDAEEVFTTVDADGNYAFTITGITSSQTLTLAIESSSVPDDLELLNPITGSQPVDVSPGLGVEVDFTLQRLGGEPALIQGVVFEDLNQNTTFDDNEIGLGLTNQVRVYLDLNNNGIYEESLEEPSALTLSDGTFAIESEEAGNFNIRVDLDSTPLTLSSPVNNAINLDVVVGQAISDLEFGMFDSRTQDFGDLLGYPTLLSENGARHVVTPSVYLGSRIDIDDDGMPSADARGDDSDNLSDEDGVVILNDIAADTEFTLEITPFGEGASLNAWIDFNNDGDWDDEGEQIFVDAGLVLGQKNTLTVMAPSDVDPTATELAARFRWGPFGLSYDGPANAGEVEDYLLPTSTPVNISGEVRLDDDGDGTFDLTDSPVADVIVYYDENLDGVRQASEISSITNAAGEYQLAISTDVDLAVTLRIDEDSLVNGEDFVAPIDGIFSQVVSPGVPVTADFLVGFPQGIQGNVFADEDNNGLRGGTETGFEGITVNLFADNNNDGSFETLVATAVTDSEGDYIIPVSVADTYEIRIDISDLEFHVQTTPTDSLEVDIAAGVVGTTVDIGVYNQALGFTADYGDLFGTNFPTLEADNGASHTVVTGYFLGSSIDADPGTLTSTNATADDNSLTDDEDGVVLVSNEILTNSTVEIDVTVNGVGGFLNAWIDFNNDGDWDDDGEQILIDRTATSGATTRFVIDTTDIEVAAPGVELAARFRWGSAGLGYSGSDTLGEVEDYLLPTLTIDPSGIVGDYNSDGQVDGDDYSTWAINYGSTTNLGADGNNDNVVDAADYTIWRDAYEAALAAPAFITTSEEEDSNSPDEYVLVSPLSDLAQATSSALVVEAAEAELPELVQHPIVETVEIVASVSQSLVLEAAVLIESTQDESFAFSTEEDSEVVLDSHILDSALLELDDLQLGTTLSEDPEISLIDEEEEDEDSLDEALSEAFSVI